mmetsp:Transcript_30333/g.71766  ORF Transcript_30333/g.71766 Transcript_30333/m.71766 type:complete len:360 (+) Transcript_30333:863-1942(+)
MRVATARIARGALPVPSSTDTRACVTFAPLFAHTSPAPAGGDSAATDGQLQSEVVVAHVTVQGVEKAGAWFTASTRTMKVWRVEASKPRVSPKGSVPSTEPPSSTSCTVTDDVPEASGIGEMMRVPSAVMTGMDANRDGADISTTTKDAVWRMQCASSDPRYSSGGGQVPFASLSGPKEMSAANEGKEAGAFSVTRAKDAAEKEGKLLTGRTTISVRIVTSFSPPHVVPPASRSVRLTATTPKRKGAGSNVSVPLACIRGGWEKRSDGGTAMMNVSSWKGSSSGACSAAIPSEVMFVAIGMANHPESSSTVTLGARSAKEGARFCTAIANILPWDVAGRNSEFPAWESVKLTEKKTSPR